jgi:hypothetical protein
MRKNWLTTIGGIMALFTLLPPALGQANMHAPNWLNLTFFCVGAIGTGIIGIAAKGQDEHSTPTQVQQAAPPPQPPASLPPQQTGQPQIQQPPQQ